MGMNLIEVALALVTIYLVMALGATQLVELLAAASNRRPKILEAIVGEAFSGQAGLVDDFFGYAPIYALSRGKRRPAAIPPDLFATAFLAVLNGRKPPRADFRTPAEFVAAAKPPGDRLAQVLAAQLAGAEADWDAFEQRIARWYNDICDRSEGWYKRETTWWLLGISVLMSVLLNTDSGHIVRSLLENDTLRVSIANVGELLFEQQGQGQRASLAAPAASTAALPGADDNTARSLVSGELDRALGEIRTALNAVPALGAYGGNVGTFAQNCVDDEPKYKNELFDSNYEAWTYLIASVISKVDRASLGIRGDEPFLEEAQGRIRNIRQAIFCTSAIGKWMRSARGEPRNKAAEPNLAAAIAALDRARGYMEALAERATLPQNLARAYALLGQDFVDCANAAGRSRAAFERCIETAQTASLPFGWPGQAGQFCRMTLHDPGEGILRADALPVNAIPAVNRDLDDWKAWFGCQDYDGNSTLDLPAIHARVSWPKLIAVVIGWLSTAVLVSLGAPFWYDLLGKVARLRIAGRVRGLDQAPEEAPKSGTGPAAPRDLPPAPPAPFDSALNDYERAMPPKEISRLQIALGVAPTMQLNEATRNAIAARLEALGQPPDRELTPSTYYMIVGRNPVQATVDTPASMAWTVGTRDPVAVAQLIDALNRAFPHNPPPLDRGEAFTHEVRARAVLFRFRSDPAGPLAQKKVVKMAAPGGDLMRLDAATRRDILAWPAASAFAPDQHPWLDLAWGELGVNESSPEGLARIDDYLAAVGGPGDPGRGTSVAWCGAFVGWVLHRAGKFPDAKPRPDLLRAAAWKTFKPSAQGSAGDICIVGDHHVAFLVETDTQGRGYWLLGGNQGPGGAGGVTLVLFKAAGDFSFVPVANVQ